MAVADPPPATSGSPQPWTPSTTPLNLKGGSLLAGDWFQVFVSYRTTNTSSPVLAPGYFLFHVLVTPTSDDSISHKDMPTTYGGSAKNIPGRVYRVDPGLCVQVPWNSQIKIVAGGDAVAATCVVDVTLVRGHGPRLPVNPQHGPFGAVFACDTPAGPHAWAPPIVGTPQEVFCTYLGVPITTPIEYPSGAIGMQAVDTSGVPGNPIQITSATMGMIIPQNLASGQRGVIAAVAQGGGATNATPATWGVRAVAGGTLESVTIFQSFGG